MIHALCAAGFGILLGAALVVRWRPTFAALLERVNELFTDSATGEWSPSKAWLSLGNAAMTVGFLKVVWVSGVSEGLSFFFMVYGGIVAGSQLLNRYLGQKAGGNGAAAAPEERKS